MEPATGPKDVARTHHRRPGELGEFAKDWRRWSRAERVAAVAIVAVSLIGLPATLALNGL